MATTRGDSLLHDGLHYPVRHLEAILRNRYEAEQAAQRLREAGYTDVVVFNGQRALGAITANERAANPLLRAWERLRAYLDDPDGRREVLDALAEGHALVMVYAADEAQEDEAERMLRAGGARAVRYFGRWTISGIGL